MAHLTGLPPRMVGYWLYGVWRTLYTKLGSLKVDSVGVGLCSVEGRGSLVANGLVLIR
jgi:hypothetical protein